MVVTHARSSQAWRRCARDPAQRCAAQGPSKGDQTDIIRGSLGGRGAGSRERRRALAALRLLKLWLDAATAAGRRLCRPGPRHRVDVAFPSGDLPAINEALELFADVGHRLLFEVHRHLDVIGEPLDGLPAFGAEVPRRPIHGTAPSFRDQGAAREILRTGIKVSIHHPPG